MSHITRVSTPRTHQIFHRCILFDLEIQLAPVDVYNAELDPIFRLCLFRWIFNSSILFQMGVNDVLCNHFETLRGIVFLDSKAIAHEEANRFGGNFSLLAVFLDDSSEFSASFDLESNFTLWVVFLNLEGDVFGHWGRWTWELRDPVVEHRVLIRV